MNRRRARIEANRQAARYRLQPGTRSAADLLRQMREDPRRRRPTPYTARNRDRLIAALEAARRSVCAYGPEARTCDCKYGMFPPAADAPFQGPKFLGSEETGCPELRDLIRTLEREAEEPGDSLPPTRRPAGEPQC